MFWTGRLPEAAIAGLSSVLGRRMYQGLLSFWGMSWSPQLDRSPAPGRSTSSGPQVQQVGSSGPSQQLCTSVQTPICSDGHMVSSDL